MPIFAPDGAVIAPTVTACCMTCGDPLVRVWAGQGRFRWVHKGHQRRRVGLHVAVPIHTRIT